MNAPAEPYKSSTLYCGHVLDILRTLPAESVQTCVTSPPYYNLRSYDVPDQVWGGDPECKHAHLLGRTYYVSNGAAASAGSAEAFNSAGAANAERVKAARWRSEKSCPDCGAWIGQLGLEPSPSLYVEHLVAVFEQVRRVLKSDGIVFLNLGDSYAGSGYANHSGTGGALPARGGKRTHTAGFRPGNPEKNGGISNRDGLGAIPDRKNKDLIGIPWLTAFALQAAGWWLRSDIIWAKGNPMPDPAPDRPSSAHEYIFLLSKSERYFYDAAAVRQLNVSREQLRHQLRYAKKYPAFDDRVLAAGVPGHQNSQGIHSRPGKDGAALLDVWSVQVKASGVEHYATYPEALIVPCVRAGSAMGDTILDPFAGTGTTCAVATKLGRRAIGIELSEKSFQIASARLSQTAMDMTSVLP